MIKWGGTNDKRKVIGLGLTRANVEKLKQGHPIHIECEEFGVLGVDVVLHYGNTEAALIMEMRDHGVTTPLTRKDV